MLNILYNLSKFLINFYEPSLNDGSFNLIS
nr:MAG TPA: hypothetical protein [Caudoviricetes sp.]